MDNITNFVVNKGVKGLVDKGLKTLPEKYILPFEKRFDTNKVETNISNNIPIIDISNDPKHEERICEAASKWGFFQIVNHGIPLEILEDLKDSIHKFFELPLEERKKYLEQNSQTETVIMSTSFSPLKENVHFWRDTLSFVYVSGDIDAHALWPTVCKDQVIEYMNKMKLLINKLIEILLKKLNITEINEERARILMGVQRLTFNYYPKCPQPELTGLGSHSDVSIITVLFQDEIGGLYVKGLDGITDKWIHVPPIKGALVVNVGDILQIMSNDKYKSVEHRVVPNKNNNRVSAPIFVNPKFNDVVGVLPEALEQEEKPIYKDFLYSDYFSDFFSKDLDGKKAMDSVRI